MARQTTTFDLLVSCPGDVVDKGYLRAVENSVAQFNSTFGKFNNVNLQVVHWSKDSYPESGGRAQELLDSQIVDNSDAAVALLYTRFGTPTDEYGSGTEEEIERMLASRKQVFMYFINEPIKPNEVDSEQYQRVVDFKSRYSKLNMGIYREVESPNELEGELVNHLSLHFLNQILKSETTDDVKPKIEIISGNPDKVVSFESPAIGTDEVLKQSRDKIISRITKLNGSVLDGEDLSDDVVHQNISSSTLKLSTMTIPDFAQQASVKFNADDMAMLRTFCDENGIELNDNFFSLGNLTQSHRLMSMGLGNTLNGSTEEKERYHSVIDVFDDIQKLQEFQTYFEELGQFHSLSLALTNSGRSFDEDIDVTLKVPMKSLVKPSDLPVPGEYIISEFNSDTAVEALFGLAATGSIDSYSSGYAVVPPFSDPVFENPMLQRSQAEIYDRDLKEYQARIDSLFQYEYFTDTNSELIKFHIGYLKQHSSMWFPTVLIFSTHLVQIEYSITSKYLPDVARGTLHIHSDGND